MPSSLHNSQYYLDQYGVIRSLLWPAGHHKTPYGKGKEYTNTHFSLKEKQFEKVSVMS